MDNGKTNSFALQATAVLLALLLAVGNWNNYISPAASSPKESGSLPAMMIGGGVSVAQQQRDSKPVVRIPKADGTVAYSNSVANIDASHTDQGYVMVQYKGSNPKVKLQITGPNKVTYTYNLGKSGYETFPLTAGNGSYTVNVFENVQGTAYSQAFGKTIEVKLASSLSPYLYPNQYVNFNAESATVAQGAVLAAGAATDMDVVDKVFNYVVGNISYDYTKAANVKSGYLPTVDNILTIKKGICFDYAAVMATMLRTQNIPTRLEVGYISDGTYHAWVSVYITDVGWVNGAIYFDGQHWKRMDPTLTSTSKGSSSIYSFTEKDSNYSLKYIY